MGVISEQPPASRPETPLARVLRKEGRRQSWLADEVGVSRTHMNAVVHGLYPTPELAVAIAEALGRTVEELWPEMAA